MSTIYPCPCGLPLIVSFTATTWRVQHGPNPEHAMEGTRDGRVLHDYPPDLKIEVALYPPHAKISGTWIDAVHARMGGS